MTPAHFQATVVPCRVVFAIQADTDSQEDFVQEKIKNLCPPGETLIDPNIRSSNTEHINCLTIGTNTGGGQAGGEQVFDNLLNRKYSKVNTIKSAFAILSLVKWYLCKVKLLQKLPQTEKDLKLTQMKKSLSVRREQKPFLPTCPITCGLDGRVGCGHKHSVFSDHLFSTVDTNPGWPLVGAEANVTVKDILKNIKIQLNKLG